MSEYANAIKELKKKFSDGTMDDLDLTVWWGEPEVSRETYKNAVKQLARLRANLDEANENLVSMVNQYCAKTSRTDKVLNCYSHDFMSTGEAAFEYLVTHGLAKWCENGVDICDLKWPSQEAAPGEQEPTKP